jgi:hypothetical protein
MTYRPIKISSDYFPPTRSRNPLTKQWLRELDINQSFFIPFSDPEAKRFSDEQNLRSSLAGLSRHLNIKISINKRIEDGETGIRVRRIS